MVAVGVLSQTLGTWDRSMAYLPKRLGSVATGCPGCLQVVAAVALLVQEATKDFGPRFDRKSPARSTLSCEGTPINGCQHLGLLNTRVYYVKTPVTIEPCQALNPATLLPVGEGGPLHDCKEICQQT